MKRVIMTAAAAILLLMTTACGKSAHNLDGSYEGEVQATDGKMNYIAYAVSDGEDVTVTLSVPESVAGLAYEFRGDELHTRLDGLDCITASDSLPPASFVSLLNEVFTKADGAEYTKTVDGIDNYTLDTRGGTAVIEAKDGRIRSISAEYGSWNIELS